MLDLVCIITTGGVLLFSKFADNLPDLLTPMVVHILEARSSESAMEVDRYRVKYIVDGMMGLIFVVAWNKDFILEKAD
jgi:hypothetical protein